MEYKKNYTIDKNLNPEHWVYMLENALAALGDTCIVDQHGKYIFISDSYARHMEISASEAIGKPITDILPDSRLPTVLKTGKSIREELYQRNGKTSLINRFPIKDRSNHVLGVIAYALAAENDAVYQIQNRLNDAVQQVNYYKEKLRKLEGKRVSIDAIVARSESMRTLKETLAVVARTRSTILITGESGTGKEVVSNAIHDLSPRSGNAFIRLNCAAIPDNLLEAELFGYEGGSFTGALKGGKIGDFEAANHGTILLDEVDALTPNMQSKLLRVIQEREVKRIGSVKPIPLDVRFIFATNKDLQALVREKKFREDFYYRINVISLEIPPLRERMEDIPPLVDHFIQKFNRELQMGIRGISPAAMRRLLDYSWPGNIRELENYVERAFNYSSGDFLEEEAFGMAGTCKEGGGDNEPVPVSLRAVREKAERAAILRALEQVGGNKKEAAKLLEIDRSLLYDKLKRYEIPVDVQE